MRVFDKRKVIIAVVLTAILLFTGMVQVLITLCKPCFEETVCAPCWNYISVFGLDLIPIGAYGAVVNFILTLPVAFLISYVMAFIIVEIFIRVKK